MKKKIICIIFLLLTVLFMGMIFHFSSQENSSTNSLSKFVTEKISELIFPNFSVLELNSREILINEMNLFIRKAAHFSLFFFMSLMIYILFSVWKERYFTSGLISVGCCIIYAIIDECHQHFVPGRTPLVKDVFIDSAGAVLGTFFGFLIISGFLTIIKFSKKS